MIRSSYALAFGVVAAFLAACTAADDDIHSVELRETEAAPNPVLGADRVGDILRKDTSKIPTNLAEVEAMFGVGRACARPDSKEIYIVEETAGRKPDGTNIGVDAPIPLLPRAVISGCNTKTLSNAGSLAESYGFFIALVSDPDRAHTTSGDGMLLEDVEVMTYDREVGTYNFYIFGHDKAGAPQLRRIFRRDDGTVFERTLNAGATVASAEGETTAKCFGCHVNGGPFMNEMRDPWTNWISFKQSTNLVLTSGATKDLVSESVPDPSTGRSSLANDLEPVMRAAIRAHVAIGERGFAPNLSKKPGGVAQLLDSVFCQTELNFATSTDAVPMEAYLDPDLAGGDLVAPTSFEISPFQLPIRAELDHAVERWLENEGYLSRSLTTAIRLLDDENDIFSDARCAPFKSELRPQLVTAGVPDRAAAQALVLQHVTARVNALVMQDQPKRLALLELLIDPAATPEALKTARAEYAKELAGRFATMTKDATRIAAREADRKTRARAMFPGITSPLPLMTLR